MNFKIKYARDWATLFVALLGLFFVGYGLYLGDEYNDFYYTLSVAGAMLFAGVIIWKSKDKPKQ